MKFFENFSKIFFEFFFFENFFESRKIAQNPARKKKRQNCILYFILGDYNNDRPRREYNDDKQQIFVGGLPYDISEQSLREVFR